MVYFYFLDLVNMLMLHGKSRCCSKLNAEFSLFYFVFSADQRFIEQ